MKLRLPISFAYLLKSLGLCMWQDLDHLLDKDYTMQVPEIREFLAVVKSSQMVFPTYDEILARHPIGVGTINYWYSQYSKARRDLIEFLEKSIEADSPIKIKA